MLGCGAVFLGRGRVPCGPSCYSPCSCYPEDRRVLPPLISFDIDNTTVIPLPSAVGSHLVMSGVIPPPFWMWRRTGFR